MELIVNQMIINPAIVAFFLALLSSFTIGRWATLVVGFIAVILMAGGVLIIPGIPLFVPLG